MSSATMNISAEAELQANTRTSVAEVRATTLSATVDFDRDGVQHGFIKLPYSHDQSAWGCIMIPISVVKNGIGPTALLTATVDFDRDGVQHGFIKLPYSHDQSAWGCIMIPISVVKNGIGPTALLT